MVLIGSPTGGAVCRGCRPFRCRLHGGRTLLGAGLEGYKPHPPPFTFSTSYVWREMWPLSLLFLLPYFPAMTDSYTPAEINAFTKWLLLLVFYLCMPGGSSRLLCTIQGFHQEVFPLGSQLRVLKPWAEAAPLPHPQPFILLDLTCVFFSPCSLTEFISY